MNELVDLIERHVTREGTSESAISTLSLSHRSSPIGPLYGIQDPSICIVVQGKKSIYVGDDILEYGPGDILISSLDLPITEHINDASPELPFLLVKLQISPTQILSAMNELNTVPQIKKNISRGITVDKLTPPILDAITRLARLLDSPDEIALMSPLIIRETISRLLQSPSGHILEQVVLRGSSANKISTAINFIMENYTESLKLADIYELTNMSSTTLNRHFKKATGMSPLQFQKRLRLQEARQRLLLGVHNVTEVAFQIGFESLSHFNRDYVRMFGAPPKKDIKQLTEANQ